MCGSPPAADPDPEPAAARVEPGAELGADPLGEGVEVPDSRSPCGPVPDNGATNGVWAENLLTSANDKEPAFMAMFGGTKTLPVFSVGRRGNKLPPGSKEDPEPGAI
jgi:hypothetical protein